VKGGTVVARAGFIETQYYVWIARLVNYLNMVQESGGVFCSGWKPRRLSARQAWLQNSVTAIRPSWSMRLRSSPY